MLAANERFHDALRHHPGGTFPDYNGYWFWGRPSVVDLWHDLRDVAREIRHDWDLSAPGLREAWDAGDLSPFHGWNKHAAASQAPA
jgi:hypothetical protein